MKINFDKNTDFDKEITLLDFNSELWEACHGAYGNVVETVRILMDDEPVTPQQRIRRLDTSEKSDYEIVFENLCENLWHQLSFYNATYVVLPYLVTLLEKKEAQNDFKWQLDLISAIGTCLMTDIPGNHFEPVENNKILINYNKSILIVQEKTKAFLEQNIEKLREIDENVKSYFYIAVLAILDDREAAFVLAELMFHECYVLCGECGYCNEDMEPFSEGVPEAICPAESVIGKWDGRSLDDTYLWFSNVLDMLGDKQAVKALSCYYGTYTCPECGTQGLVMDLAKKYFFDMESCC